KALLLAAATAAVLVPQMAIARAAHPTRVDAGHAAPPFDGAKFWEEQINRSAWELPTCRGKGARLRLPFQSVTVPDRLRHEAPACARSVSESEEESTKLAVRDAPDRQ